MRADWNLIKEQVKDVKIRTLGLYHDTEQGLKYGRNTAFILEVDGWRLAMVHDTEPEERPIEELRRTYLRKERADIIVTGHTHFADDVHISGTHYINSGCWTEPPCSYLVADQARVSLHVVPD